MRFLRRPSILAAFWMALAFHLPAQTISTVRESEFRSRWTDYQVDLQESDNAANPKTLREKLRVGPVDLRGGISAGWEYSNENFQNNARRMASKSSFFTAPTIAALYEKDLGAWKVSARYSVGWIFYLDQDYVANGDGANSSQTASLDLLRTGDRLTIRSDAQASYGTGFDIERAQQIKRLSFGETLAAEYQLSEFIRTGASTGYNFQSFSSLDGANIATDDENSQISAATFLDDFLTDKTALRGELSGGRESRSFGRSSTLERNYVQGIARINYGATAKLSLTGSAGVGFLNDTDPAAEKDDGLRAVYSIAGNYSPTEKTTATLFLGLEGSASTPEVNFAVNWHPRDRFALSLSVYQQSGRSLLSSNTIQRISRGVLLSAQQQLFSTIVISLSGGVEEFEYEDSENNRADDQEPYSFAALSAGWQISEYLSLQGQVRTSSRRNAESGFDDEGQQTRASMSLGLTF